MSAAVIILIIGLYFFLLYIIARITGKNANNATFFLGQRKSPWYLVAFGMIGASISGVSFISVPGWVGTSQFSYLQMVLGYVVGYIIIAFVLLPVYYKINLTTIYTYLKYRFGESSYLTGASFFLLSRTVGSAVRLFLSANVLHLVIFQQMGIPFIVTVIISLALIYLYTYKGGIRTVVFTDTLQTLFLILALIICMYVIIKQLNSNILNTFQLIADSSYSKIFFWDDWHDKRHFLKQFLSGIFICIAMTGLDQDLMQKNLSCKNLKEAQKNMLWYGIALVPVNIMFLTLGALLYIYAAQTNFILPKAADDLFPSIIMQPIMPNFLIITFVLGLVAATYSSADSALTALTTSFTIDILKSHEKGEKILEKHRKIVHLVMAVLLFILIMILKAVNNQSIISTLFIIAGYTYGPLLGLFAFGLFTKYKVYDKYVPIIAIISPIVCVLLDIIFPKELGYEMLIINGLITFVGLSLIRKVNSNLLNK